jgi:hypothetical protein
VKGKVESDVKDDIEKLVKDSSKTCVFLPVQNMRLSPPPLSGVVGRGKKKGKRL